MNLMMRDMRVSCRTGGEHAYWLEYCVSTQSLHMGTGLKAIRRQFVWTQQPE